MTSDEFSNIEQLDENLRKWFKEKWVRFGPDGKIRGACARGDDSEGKPKCLPQKKAQNLGKKGRKYAASKKRREDPNPERTGKAKNVATKKKTDENAGRSSEIEIPTEDGITMQDIRLMAGEGKLPKKTVLQAIEVIRKQRKSRNLPESVPFDECPKCRGPIVHESMMNEKQDACYHKVKSRYKVWPSAYASGALVQCRKKGASNWGTGGKKSESSIMKGIVDEAGSAAQQAAIAISKKERGEKPKHVDEAKAKQYVKPYNDPQTGEQIGWVSSDGYHKKYWQKFAKNSAIKHAKLNPDEVDEAYTGQFAAEKTPKINPYGGLKDNQFRGAISETPTDNPTGASGEGGLRKYRPKSAGTFKEDELDEACWKGYHKEGNKKMFGKTYPNCVKNTNEEEQLDEGVMQKIGAAAMAAALALVGAKANAEPVYVYQDVAGTYSAALSPQDIPNDAVRKLVVDTDDDSVAILKGNSKIPINLTPAVVNYIKQQAGVGRAKSTQPQAAAQQSAAPKNIKQNQSQPAEANQFSIKGISFGLTKDQISNLIGGKDGQPSAGFTIGGASDWQMKYNSEGKLEEIITFSPYGGLLTALSDKYGKPKYDFKFSKSDGPQNEGSTQFLVWEVPGAKITYVFPKKNVLGKYTGITYASFQSPEVQQKQVADRDAELTKAKQDFEEDTAYAGGMGQGGNAGESYRKFKPKSAGTFKEEQLDEKCWDTHKQVGMKNKGGRQVPNCVPKESSIMKGLKSL
jgi:hypothetical protein